MQPWLHLPGGIDLPTYLTLIATGLALATFVVRREAQRAGLPVREVFDVALVLIPAAFLFGRLIVVLEDPIRWLSDPTRLLTTGGYTFYGSFLGVSVALWLASRWRGLPPRQVLDVFAVAMPFGIPWGRLGCLGAGCCHGRPADWPLGIEVPWSVRYYALGRFPEPLLAVPLHPTPLYDAVGGLGLFIALTRLHARRPPPGAVFAALLMGYAVLRSTTELFRGDLERGFFFDGWLSTAQATSIPVFLSGALLWWRVHRPES